MNVGDLIKEGEYYVNLDYCEGIDSFNDCWNIRVHVHGSFVWTIVNGLIVLMIVGILLTVLFVIIQYLLIRRAWKEW